MTCYATQAAIVVDRSINTDLEINNGIKLIRNHEKIHFRKGKSRDPFLRLAISLANYLNTHSLSLNLIELEGRAETSRRGGGGGGFFNLNSKAVRKEKRYSKYAFLVLLGIFGLTGPLFMKILAIIAAQALMAAKAALIIVGGVALKKLFEKKEEKPVVKVATVPLHDEEDHDRLGYVVSYYPNGYSNDVKQQNSPYSAYYSESDYNKFEYAPIIYGKRYNSETNKKTK